MRPAAARADDPPPSASPSPSPAPERPIATSVDRIAKEMQEERDAPCRKELEAGRPCFPVVVEAHTPEFSVKSGLQEWIEKQQHIYRGGAVPPTSGITIDPGCQGRSAIK